MVVACCGAEYAPVPIASPLVKLRRGIVPLPLVVELCKTTSACPDAPSPAPSLPSSARRFYSGAFKSGINFKAKRISKQLIPEDSISGYIKKPRSKEVGGEEVGRSNPSRPPRALPSRRLSPMPAACRPARRRPT